VPKRQHHNSKAESQSRVRRTVEAVPWGVVMRGGVIVGKRWAALSARERARLSQLVRESRGRIGNLSAKQRVELRKLARKLELTSMGDELLTLVRSDKRSRKRR
jgi:hypothetical protein